MFIKANDVLALLPFLFVTAISMFVVMVDAFHRTDRPRGYIATLSWVGLLLTLPVIWLAYEMIPAGSYFYGMFYHDGFTAIMSAIFVSCGALTLMMSPPYLREHGADRGEFYALVLMSITGMMLMAAAGDLIVLFVGLEVMSVAIYVLAGFFRRDARSAEGAAKYFFLGAFASAIFLYGAALVYGATGATSLESIAEAIRVSAGNEDNILVLQPDSPLGAEGLDAMFWLGALMLLAGMAFKVALVPFHMWTPDAYEGAPSTAAGFMASAVKAAGFAALIRVVFIALGPEATRLGEFGWTEVLFWLSGITIVLGNLLAIVQDNVKRMLAYSSIAHAGYATIGVTAAGYMGAGQSEVVLGYLSAESVIFYLITYALATLGAFGCLAYLSNRNRQIETYDDLGGVGYKYPLVGGLMTVFMLSSAGIPPTAGFVGKFHVFRSAIVASGESGDNAFVWLVVLAVVASVAGAYYYLRVVVNMYMRPTRGTVEATHTPTGLFALLVCALGTLWIGVFPSKTLDVPGMLEVSAKSMQDFQGADAAYRTLDPSARAPRGQSRTREKALARASP